MEGMLYVFFEEKKFMKGLVYLIVTLMLSSSVAAIGLTSEEQPRSESLSFSFQGPTVVDDGLYVKVEMQGAAACLYHAGKPVLPMYTTTMELPFGSTIQDVTLIVKEIKTMVLPKKIALAPYPIIGGLQQSSEIVAGEVYSSEELYPNEWYTYTTGSGLNNQGTHMMFFTLRLFPVRYSPGTDTLLYLNDCQATVTYTPPAQPPFPSQSIYHLVIITPSQFVLPLQRLANHKNNVGVRTQISTLEDIYREYPGTDRPEQIKYFIQDAIENWGISYVLLVGGLKSHLVGKARDDLNEGTRNWHLPVRYSNLQDIGFLYDPGFISDLYYADIYNGEGSFCSWDSNGDGVFGGWSNENPLSPLGEETDLIDFYPDVYLGRIPCRNIFEVYSIVNKIIRYEKKTADPSWFNNIIVVGGDPYDDQGTNYNEGELIGEKTLSYMPGFQQQRLYASYRDSDPESTPVASNIIRTISAGCGFLFMDGHGSPAWWNTYWPGEFETLIKNGGLSIYQFPQVHNSERLPICIIGGCHCSQFNVTLFNTITDPKNLRSMWSYGLPIPECWSWALTVKPKGGTIATIGSTGLGYEAGGEVGDLNGDSLNEPDCVEALGGYLQIQFFKAYGVEKIDILGNAWGTALRTYINTFPGMENRSDAKTIEQWVLLGDPSLKIGGYPS